MREEAEGRVKNLFCERKKGELVKTFLCERKRKGELLKTFLCERKKLLKPSCARGSGRASC